MMVAVHPSVCSINLAQLVPNWSGHQSINAFNYIQTRYL